MARALHKEGWSPKYMANKDWSALLGQGFAAGVGIYNNLRAEWERAGAQAPQRDATVRATMIQACQDAAVKIVSQKVDDLNAAGIGMSTENDETYKERMEARIRKSLSSYIASDPIPDTWRIVGVEHDFGPDFGNARADLWFETILALWQASITRANSPSRLNTALRPFWNTLIVLSSFIMVGPFKRRLVSQYTDISLASLYLSRAGHLILSHSQYPLRACLFGFLLHESFGRLWNERSVERQCLGCQLSIRISSDNARTTRLALLTTMIRPLWFKTTSRLDRVCTGCGVKQPCVGFSIDWTDAENPQWEYFCSACYTFKVLSGERQLYSLGGYNA